MDQRDRRRKKIAEAKRLRDVPPELTVQTGAQMLLAARRIAEAADRAEL